MGWASEAEHALSAGTASSTGAGACTEARRQWPRASAAASVPARPWPPPSAPEHVPRSWLRPVCMCAGEPGGAGAVGSTGNNSAPYSTGGIGLNTYSSYASATSTGDSGYYAGGGGGSNFSSTAVSAGGLGGGGNGAYFSPGNNGSNALANTGGGGGGMVKASGSGSYNGGSGIIIVRYAV